MKPITMTLLPRGLFRLLGPLIRRGFQNKEENNLARLRTVLEGSGGASAVDGA